MAFFDIVVKQHQKENSSLVSPIKVLDGAERNYKVISVVLQSEQGISATFLQELC